GGGGRARFLWSRPLRRRRGRLRLGWGWRRWGAVLVPGQLVAPRPRPPLLQLDLAWPQSRSARSRLAQWRKRCSQPQAPGPKPCSPKCALNGGRSFGHSPKNFREPASRASPHVQIKRHPTANLTLIRQPRQQRTQSLGVILVDFGPLSPACHVRSNFFSESATGLQRRRFRTRDFGIEPERIELAVKC